mgnify:CR=1 FL=1
MYEMEDWKPEYQIGTPWVAHATGNDAKVILWLCSVQLAIGVLVACATSKKEFSKLDEDRIHETENISTKTQIDMFHIFKILAPMFGILAVKLDCLQLLKVNLISQNRAQNVVLKKILKHFLELLHVPKTSQTNLYHG